MKPAGQCRFCQCTAECPCKLANGDECCFVTKLANRCTAPACVRAFERERYVEFVAEMARSRKYAELSRKLKEARRARRRRKAA